MHRLTFAVAVSMLLFVLAATSGWSWIGTGTGYNEPTLTEWWNTYVYGLPQGSTTNSLPGAIANDELVKYESAPTVTWLQKWASYSVTTGWYTSDPLTTHQVFEANPTWASGRIRGTGPADTADPLPADTYVGWYMYVQNTSTPWYSETSRNGGDDHLKTRYLAAGTDFSWAYNTTTHLWTDSTWSNMYVRNADGSLKLPDQSAPISATNLPTYLLHGDQYLMAWEDLPLPASDQDYNDLLVAAFDGTVSFAPEPMSLGLLAMACFGAVMAGRKRRKA